MYEYEMEESERKSITICMSYEMEENERKGITVCVGIKWKRVSFRVSQYVWV